MSRIGMKQITKRVWVWCVTVASILLSSHAFAAATTISDLEFSALPGDKVEIRLDFEGSAPNVKSYSIEQPARIALDVMETASALSSKYFNLGFGNARSVTVVEAGDRSRIIINLTDLVPYSTEIIDNSLYVLIGLTEEEDRIIQTEIQSTGTASAPASYQEEAFSIVDVDFRRGSQGEGEVIVGLSRPDVSVDLVREGDDIIISFNKVEMPSNLHRLLDVADFATPVKTVEALSDSGSGVLKIHAAGQYDYLAYQANNEYILSVKPITDAEKERIKKDKFPYTGEKLSLNFQDIEVRSVLQLIADFTGLNLVASDTVTGQITIRLQNVPWDQALELVLKTKGLAKRQVGNVLLVAPATEIAERERLEIENRQQFEELAPMQTEFIQVRYAKASEILPLLSVEQGITSTRGSVSVDPRTNILIVSDTVENLNEIRNLLSVLDVPVKQVLIEARIVTATTDVSKELGVRWGATDFDLHNNNNSFTSLSGSIEQQTNTSQFVTGNTTNMVTYPDALMVDMGVTGATSSFAFGVATNTGILDVELSAVESDGRGEVISQPKVVTADRQTAIIESGTEVPYQEASSSGATTTSFKDAVLALEVTPQITPDNSVIMDLRINQDAVIDTGVDTPSIETKSIQTQVLVKNGETIVLGGIFEEQEVETVTKTPFLGDIPYIGRLFRREGKSHERSELLIFITPRIIDEDLTTY